VAVGTTSIVITFAPPDAPGNKNMYGLGELQDNRALPATLDLIFD
jgi:hypothetical protein